MRKIKTITNRHPEFLKTAYAHDNLVDLHNDERFIVVGEKYISYDGAWKVYKMTKNRVPRLCGRFKVLHSAVHRARLNI